MAGGYNQFSPMVPEDPDIRNIIDKLAIFVARNGPEFEQMTMAKQRENLKFSFLFGGDLHPYYRWKVSQEQAAFHGQQPRPVPASTGGHGLLQPPPMPHPPGGNKVLLGNYPGASLASHPEPGYTNYSAYQTSQAAVGSLATATSYSSGVGQQGVPQQHQVQAPSSEASAPPWVKQQSGSNFIQLLKQTRLREQASLQQFGIADPMEADFTEVVSPIMESCTKDSIAAGKSWIFSHTRSPEESQNVARFIMRKTLNSPGVGFPQKLHIIYLINDVLHHCLRKGAQDLKQALGGNVVQIFYNTYTSEPDKADSLLKVLKIWKTQEYFDKKILEQIEAVVTGNTESLNDTSGPEAPSHEASGGFPQQQPTNDPPSLMQSPWQQHQQSPPSWRQEQGSASQTWRAPQATSSRWDQPRPPQPMPLFPTSHPDEPPPPPPSSHLRPLAEYENRGPEIEDKQSFESFDYNHQSRPQAPSDPPREVFDYHHGQAHPVPPAPQDPPREVHNYHHGRAHPVLPGPAPQDPLREVHDYHHSQAPPMPPGPVPPQWRGLPPAPHIPAPPPHMQAPPPRMPIPPPHHMGGPPLPLLPPPDVAPWGAPRPNLPPMPPADLPPSIPYYELPAGIMVALVPLHEHGYHSINPRDVILPPPQPPTERLLKAVEEFYESDGEEGEEAEKKETDEQEGEKKETEEKEGQRDTKEEEDDKENKIKRNEEGWEAGALLNFFEAKRRAKVSMMNAFRPRRPLPPPRRRSRSLSRRRRSRSYSSSRSRSYSRSRSRDRSYSRSKSRSRSPRKRRSSRSPSSRSSSRSRSRSRSPAYRRHDNRQPPRRGSSPDRQFSNPNSRFTETERQYPDSEQQFTDSGRQFTNPDRQFTDFDGQFTDSGRNDWQPPNSRLSEGNMGHQMMRRMGWEGAGLGSDEQGIQEPIKGGDVRDKMDKYKGVGMDMKDPFEMFRKNRSYTFNRRRSPGR